MKGEEKPAYPLTHWRKRLGSLLLAFLLLAASACSRQSWRESGRDSAGLAPMPEEHHDAVVMAFRARVWGVRGLVADHTWLATKEEGANSYTVYEVIGWRKYRNQAVVRIAEDVPDRHWFGAEPRVMVDMRGESARGIVAKVDAAARSYPYQDEYRAFPGPNSNTFTAWIAEQVPEMGLNLPLRAVGRSYR